MKYGLDFVKIFNRIIDLPVGQESLEDHWSADSVTSRSD